jgi:resuscitation-promoting factor RpfB
LKITTLTNTLHKLHYRFKKAYLAVFCISVIVLSALSQQVSAEGVVSSIETRINYRANGKVISFITRENILANALLKQGITLSTNDITDPSLSTGLIGGELNVTLVPSQPVLISDNGQSWVGKSAYTSTSDILKQLKVEVDKADKVSTELIFNPEAENMAGQKITIRRAPVYTVSVDGIKAVVHSWSKTVLEVLNEGGITLNQNDTTDPARTAPAPTSGQIEVVRVNYADIEETIPVAFQTVSQTSYDLYKGQTKVTQQGVNGSRKQNVHIVYNDGVEVSRDITGTVVLSLPQNKITIVGVKPYNAGMWWDTIVVASQKYGVSAEKMFNVMNCESGGDPTRVSGAGYVGLFQWDTSFTSWSAKAGYAGADRTDATAQIYATALRASQNGWGAWGTCGAR